MRQSKYRPYPLFAIFGILCIGIVLGISKLTLESRNGPQFVTGHGDPNALAQKYAVWKESYEANRGAEIFTLPLRYSKAFATEPTDATAIVKLNLLNGQLRITFNHFKTGEDYALWMIGGALNNDKQIIEKKIGVFNVSGHQNTYLATLKRSEFQDFFINQIVISRAGQTHAKPALIAGTPSFFQRLYYANQLWPLAGIGQLAKTPSETSFSFLLPKLAYANTSSPDLATVLSQQIALGRELFIHETFEGNGRTCATCHRLDNNHTIDPKYIAKLPNDDPLFVAETNPALKGLENPKLLRQFGLIRANADGFDRPGVLRGVPHLLALATSIAPESDKDGKFVLNATGWSGDGAPGDGSLRMFSVGAIIQHFPKTLNRAANVDYRLPDDNELNALEAYLLSLGRTEEPDLNHLYFSSPVVQRGRELFHSKDPGTAQCKGCHFNGGAISSTTFQNGNRDTGVENLPENPARLTWEPTPVDGGFGKHERHNCGWDKQQTCYGNGEFNMTTVIEAADTAPYFHNNSVSTIEEAVAFYNSNAFHNSPGANPADLTLIPPRPTCDRCTHLESTQVIAVALFLRTLNAMENIRSSNAMLKQVKDLGIVSGREILRLAMADTEDAVEVLEGGHLIANPDSLKLLKQALETEQTALGYFSSQRRNQLLDQAIATKLQANDLLLSAPPASAPGA